MSRAHPFARPRLVWTVFAVVIGTLHLGVAARLTSGVPPVAAAGVAGVVAAGYLAVVGVFAARLSRRTVPTGPALAAWTWLGAVFLAFTVTAATEPVRWVVGGSAPLSAGTAALAAAAVGWGAYRARRPDLREVPVPLPGLGSPLRIAQLSDLHVGHTSTAFLREVVDAVNGAAPDLVVITGDLVEGPVSEVGPMLAPLADLRAPHGVWFVTGNHEYFADGPAWCAFLPSLGIRVLRNEHVRVGPIVLAGVDDPFGTMAPGHGTDLAAALSGVPSDAPVVLLSHQPRTIDAAAAAGVALQLSGHTHGGQIWPFGWLVRLQQPYLAGLVRHGPSWLYVHRGTGTWGPPLRVGAPAEIAVLRLTAP